MKCIISGGNIKLLARAIQLLSRIGDEMFVMPQEGSLSFRAVNGTNSAYVDVTFDENFFSYYAYEDSEDSESLKSKILIRSALSVFKAPSLIDKQIESCQIQLTPDAEQLSFILKYKNGIIKTHLLPVLDSETLKANYKKDGTPNHLCIQPKVMSDVVQNFHQNLIEITIEVLKEKVLIRNYVDEASNLSNETRTQLAFGVGEFDEYTIESNTVITFCLKELRAILHFSEALAQPIDIYFERPGRPVVFVCKSTSIETNLVLATLNPVTDGSSQSTISTKPPLPKKAPAKRAPVRSKRGVKSLSKKTFDDLSRANKTRNGNTTENLGTESPGRISDISETPFEKANRKSVNSSQTCTPKISTENLNTNNSEKNSEKSDSGSIKRNPFSSFLKRKSNQDGPDETTTDNDDMVQNSPPKHQSKKAKLIFQKCFQTTFDPRLLPGHNDVEVEDSGESD